MHVRRLNEVADKMEGGVLRYWGPAERLKCLANGGQNNRDRELIGTIELKCAPVFIWSLLIWPPLAGLIGSDTWNSKGSSHGKQLKNSDLIRSPAHSQRCGVP